MLLDYHVHCRCSPDSSASVLAQLTAAQQAGITHLCFTDHADFDGMGFSPGDFLSRNREISQIALKFPNLDIRYGVELGLGDPRYIPQAKTFLNSLPQLDFIIGSIHFADGLDVYYPEYFQGRDQKNRYRRYLEQILQLVDTWDFCVLGHYDFCAKCAPYGNRAFHYALAPDLFDAILRILIHSGRGLEINTSAWRNDPAWGVELLCRYRELGGEFITLGSDAHAPNRVGGRIPEALELARNAGIPYVASYQGLQPVFHRI